MEALVAKFRLAVPQDLPEAQKEIHRNEFYNRHKAMVVEIRMVRSPLFLQRPLSMAPGQHAADVQRWFTSGQTSKFMQGMQAKQRRQARYVYLF